MRSASTRRRTGAVASTSLALLFALSGTAFAGEKSQGDEHRKDRTAAAATVTEDNDTIDEGTAEGGEPVPNNVADSGDNMHPSGNDRSVEPGGSGNQGNSTSEPDQDGHGPERDNGGLDKPGGPGGADTSDQDGNNGCGNDDDFEDDNEGLCGSKRPVKTPPPVVGGTDEEVCPEGTTMPSGGTAPQDCEKPETTPETTVTPIDTVTPTATVTPVVLAEQLQNGTVATVEAAAPAAQVLGVVVERPAAGGTAVLGATATRAAALARTGLGTGVLVILALGLLVVGFALVRTPKGEHYLV